MKRPEKMDHASFAAWRVPVVWGAAMTIEVDTVTGPAHWASALINGDTSSFDLLDDPQSEIDALDAWRARLIAEGWYVVDQGGDVIDYVIHREVRS